jgi:predicted PurR-regulated permease PerM
LTGLSKPIREKGDKMATNHSQNFWPTPARYLALIILLLGLLGILVFIKPVFNTIALGFIFAFLFYSPIHGVSKRLKDKYGLAVGLFYLLFVILLVLILLGGLGYFVTSIQNLQQEMTPAIATLELPATIPPAITSGIQNLATWFVDALSNLISGLASIIGLVIVGLFFSALLLLNLHQGRGALANWIPDRHQNDVRQILYNLDHVWVGYMTAQIIYCAVLAAGSWVEYTLLGVPYPFLMAILTGVISLIPTIGGLLASLIVAIPCLLLGSTVLTEMSPVSFAVLVTVINVVITQISYNFVALPVIGKFVRLPVAAVLIGVLAGVAIGNILLAFLIVPIMSTLTILGGYLLSKVVRREPGSEGVPEDQKAVGFFTQLLSQI